MQENQRHAGRTKIIVTVLLVITAAAVAVSVWALFFRDTDPPLAPDYAPRETEENAVDIPDGDAESKLEQPEGGGAAGITYSDTVTVDMSDEKASLFFGNPGRSMQDMLIQIIIQDEVIVQSGRLIPGKQVTVLNLLDSAPDRLTEGVYEGKFNVIYYDPDSGEKAILNTEIPITVTVQK